MGRELTVERTRAGLEVARKLGRVGGRKRQMTDSKTESTKKLLSNGVPSRDAAHNLGVSVPTLYSWIPALSTAQRALEYVFCGAPRNIGLLVRRIRSKVHQLSA